MGARRLALPLVLGTVTLAAPLALVPAALAGTGSEPDFGGHTVALAGGTDLRSTVVVPGARSCDPTEPLPRGMSAEIIQRDGVRFAGFRSHAKCAVGADAGTVTLDILSSDFGAKPLPTTEAGDRVRVKITTSGGETVVVVRNVTQGWRASDRVPALDASTLEIGDRLAGAAGMSQALVDFGAHRFGRTTVGGESLALVDHTTTTAVDVEGTRAQPSAVRANGSFTVRQLG